ncbi:MAG TPA: hypothetical protein VND19_23730 [Acetobacteraceae bacterium]|nr:hypothetical protein [Acetobacteraceae bacterium]
MLVIRSDQMETFRRVAEQRFKVEMLKHLARFAPRHCEVIGDRQLTSVIRRGLAGAARHGFTNRGPVQLYLEFMFLFGSGFDTDPLLPWVAAALRSGGLVDDQMARAEILYRGVLDYLAAVDGPDHAYTMTALRRLQDVLAMAPPQDASAMASKFWTIHPEKCAYIGSVGLQALIAEAVAMAPRLGLSGVRGTAVAVRLMFTLGHACFDDPLYPWVVRTLADPGLADPEARTMKLENRERAFLARVLAVPELI